MDETTLKTYIQEFVVKMGIAVDSVDVLAVAGHQIFNIRTPDSKQLIGTQGEHLRALNYILRRSLEKKTGSKDNRVMVDVNGYQHKHISELEQKATLLAERVRTFKSSADMTPMSAYERMIIHSMFSDDKNITTESEGLGPNRHIILRYKEDK